MRARIKFNFMEYWTAYMYAMGKTLSWRLDPRNKGTIFPVGKKPRTQMLQRFDRISPIQSTTNWPHRIILRITNSLEEKCVHDPFKDFSACFFFLYLRKKKKQNNKNTCKADCTSWVCKKFWTVCKKFLIVIEWKTLKGIWHKTSKFLLAPIRVCCVLSGSSKRSVISTTYLLYPRFSATNDKFCAYTELEAAAHTFAAQRSRSF